MNYMKRLSYARMVPAIAMLALAAAPISATAHSLKIDGTVGAVLHLSPSDDPLAGPVTSGYLEFKSDAQAFEFSDYDISLSVSAQSGNVAHAIPKEDLKETSENTLAFSYAFPKKGVYQLTVAGAPQGGAPAFELTYDIRVAEEGSSAPRASFIQQHILHGALFGGAILISAVLIIRDERKKKKERALLKS